MNETIKRREFLKSGLRNGFLGGIVFFSGILGWKKINTSDDEITCSFRLPCQDCKKLSNCNDSKATEFKQTQNQLD